MCFMVRLFRCLGLFLLWSGTVFCFADTPTAPDLSAYFGEYTGAFVLQDAATGKTLVRYNPKRCATRFTPCSTFKIVNALIGLETGVVRGPDHRLAWDGVVRPVAEWNRDLTLRDAFAVSALWYFQRIAAGVGEKRERSYVSRLGYGNQDMSGGLTRFWLTSLSISADEQIALLQHLYRGDLPFSARTQKIVRDDLMVRSRQNGFVLRGKTGTRGSWEARRSDLGWFVGWVTEPDGHAYLFATNISGSKNPDGIKARAITEAILRGRGLLPPAPAATEGAPAPRVEKEGYVPSRHRS